MKIEIVKGTTYRDILRWASTKCAFKPITGITKAAPTVVTCVGHGLVSGWSATFESVGGMRDINDLKLQAEVIDADTFRIPCLNSLNFKAYTTGGVIRYNTPVDLSNFVGRMRIRPNDSAAPLDWIELYSNQNGPGAAFPFITLDNAAKTIERLIPISLSDTFEFTSATYTFKMFQFLGTADEESIKIDSGTITVK